MVTLFFYYPKLTALLRRPMSNPASGAGAPNRKADSDEAPAPQRSSVHGRRPCKDSPANHTRNPKELIA